MLAPPSLPNEITRRTFRAPNGELGLQLNDTNDFLAACAKDGIAILGWEVWLIDHAFDPGAGWPTPHFGQWCGLIPLATNTGVVSGNTGDKYPTEPWTTFVGRSIAETREQLARFDFDRDVAPAWQTYLRVNFTLVAETDGLSAAGR